jgi:DNA-directed RNA polymerase subunit H
MSGSIEQTTNLIFRSRKFVLDMLEQRGCDITDMRNYTADTITSMFKSYSSSKDLSTPGSLDILVKDKHNRNIFVKYNIERFRQTNKLDKLIEEIYTDTLSKGDALVFINLGRILLQKPSKTTTASKQNTVESYCNSLYSRKGYYVQVFGLDNFLFNPTDNIYVPVHKILTRDETLKILKQYSIQAQHLARIRREDPVAKWMGMRPHEVCEIKRLNKTSIESIIYRRCVP